jgi:hypothetical protein
MRPVKLVGLATRWLCAGALCASCLHVDDISLGALEQDAGSERQAPDVGVLPPPSMTVAPDAGRMGDPREDIEEDDEEARALTRDAGLPVDAAPDANALDAGTDARPLDAADGSAEAGGGDAGSDATIGADSGPLDAGSDAQRSLLCTLEPWHCL